MNRRQQVVLMILLKYVFIILGSLLVAAGLEIFFSTHNLIGGGIIGTAVVISYLTEIPLGAAVIVLNFPLALSGYRWQGKNIILPTIVAVVSLMCWISVFRPVFLEQQDILQSTIFGGICLGVGLGLILRYGAYVDGIQSSRRYPLKPESSGTGKLCILVNLLIICLSGLVFGWDKALYSMIAYFIVLKAIDATVTLHSKGHNNQLMLF